MFYKKNPSCIFAPRKGKISEIKPFQIDLFSNAPDRIFVWAQIWAQETFYFLMAHATKSACRPKFKRDGSNVALTSHTVLTPSPGCWDSVCKEESFRMTCIFTITFVCLHFCFSVTTNDLLPFQSVLYNMIKLFFFAVILFWIFI